MMYVCVCIHRHLKKTVSLNYAFKQVENGFFFYLVGNREVTCLNKIKLIILNENLLIMSHDTKKKAFQETDNKGFNKRNN